MTRFGVVLLALLGAAGCRMCASPYDYCGPVVDDCCCGSAYGAGYAPEGYSNGPVYDEGYVEESAAPMMQTPPSNMTPTPPNMIPMSSKRSMPNRSRPRSY